MVKRALSSPPLTERLIDQLTHESYECMICSEPIGRTHWLWSCRNCFAAFHFHSRFDLSCVTQWAKKSADAPTGTWRCPGCQNINVDVPKEYLCFCGKAKRPPVRRGDTPHSCGKVSRS